jgi:hypothetical protein
MLVNENRTVLRVPGNGLFGEADQPGKKIWGVLTYDDAQLS